MTELSPAELSVWEPKSVFYKLRQANQALLLCHHTATTMFHCWYGFLIVECCVRFLSKGGSHEHLDVCPSSFDEFKIRGMVTELLDIFW